MEIQVVVITPEWAAELLKKNTKNRGLKQRNIDFFIRQLACGKWKLNGETIKIGADGVLLDGQNRLHAVVKSGIPMKTFMATNVDPGVFDTIDTGAPRSTADTLTVYGEKNGRNLASALVTADNLLKGDSSFSTRNKVSNAEILDMMQRHPAIRSSLRFSNTLHSMAPASLVCALHYIFSMVNENAAGVFFDKLIHGEGLDKRDPVLLLRNRLISNAISKSKLSKRYIAALFVKAWSAHIKGEKITILRFREEGHSPEAFPSIFPR